MASGSGEKDSCDQLLQTYLQEAQALIQKCRQFQHIKGMHKLEKNCRAELRYLQSLSKKVGGHIHESQLKSSNLCHFAGILHAMQVIPGVDSLMKAIHSPNRTNNLHVDVVAGQGQVWVKVIARKAQALHLIWAGEGQFGNHDLIRQAEDYITCAKSNPVNFCPPTVNFAFYSQVTSPMAEALEERGVRVWGERVEVDPDIKVKLQAVNAVYFDSDDEGSEGYTDEESDEFSTDKDKPFLTDQNVFLVSDRGSPVSDKHLPVSNKELPLPLKGLPVPYKEFPVSNKDLFVSDNELPRSGGPLHVSRDNNYALRKAKNDSSAMEKIFHQAAVGTESCDDLSQHLSMATHNSDYTENAGNLKKLTDKTQMVLMSTGPSCGAVHSNNSSKHSNQISKTDLGDRVIGLKQWSPSISPMNDQSHSQISSVGPNEKNEDLYISSLLISIPRYDTSKIMITAEKSNSNQSSQIRKVNLDITTLITMVSAVTHGGCRFVFSEEILTLQAKDERENPALPQLQKFLDGKELYVCQTAWDDFETILNTLGGPEEKKRSSLLLNRVKVIPDQPSKRAQDLPDTGKIRQRTKVIFGTGDALGAVTTTANMGFVRAAEHQGVSFAVYSHSSRALTEDKEKNATPLDDGSV